MSSKIISDTLNKNLAAEYWRDSWNRPYQTVEDSLIKSSIKAQKSEKFSELMKTDVFELKNSMGPPDSAVGKTAPFLDQTDRGQNQYSLSGELINDHFSKSDNISGIPYYSVEKMNQPIHEGSKEEISKIIKIIEERHTIPFKNIHIMNKDNYCDIWLRDYRLDEKLFPTLKETLTTLLKNKGFTLYRLFINGRRI